MVRMMYRTEADVLTGLYAYRQPPHYPVLYVWNPNTQRHDIVASWDKSAEVFRIDSAGAGILLVKRKVYDRIKRELKERPFTRIGQTGEDHSFFTRLRKLDIPAYCAPRIEAEHLEWVGTLASRDFDPEQNPPVEFCVTDAKSAA
jgi:hypothetical protein